MVSPKAIIRLCLLGGHYAASVIEFRIARKSLPDFSGWTRHMLGYDHSRKMLNNAHVTEAIRTSGEIFIYRDIPGIVTLLARWCVLTHTFICRWGERTITLEDVAALLHLPVTSNLPIVFSAEETKTCTTLRTEMIRINVIGNCYSQWLKHWFSVEKDPARPDDSTLIIFVLLSLWLSRYVFEDDSSQLKAFVIHLARWIKVESYVNTLFIQACLWEHLSNYAPTPRNILQKKCVDSHHAFSEDNNARIMRWSNKMPRSRVRLDDLMDNEADYDFRSWAPVPSYVSRLTSFAGEEDVVLQFGNNLTDGEKHLC
ncbi:uncharacterized protein LOC113312827 [Papaver somniferum]|uniref:uncharacterized protein LOC113312827 n=1 Tax=Papaver somniferum TaxID=3469 RepID=UPI000E6F5F0A|nr:uncharacterized protein LOC113312827 [Papaver somniferum]